MNYGKDNSVTYDYLLRLKFKIGKIVDCREVSHSNRLLCVQVEVGDKRRQILSGIRQYYNAEEVIGKKVMVLDNVKAVKMSGLMSEGLLMLAEDRTGKLSFMVPDRDMESGVEII